jgi:hypothetical protein
MAKAKEETDWTRISKQRALELAAEDMTSLHNTVLRDKDFPHKQEAAKCDCDRGRSIRKLNTLRKTIGKKK